MIFANVNKAHISVVVTGNTFDIAKETAMLIDAIYSKLDGGERNECREFYREHLVKFLTDPDSPLFMPIDERAQDLTEEGCCDEG